MIIIKIIVFLLGLALVGKTLISAIRTLVLPRGAPDTIATVVFVVTRRIFLLRSNWAKDFARQDRIMALFAPVVVLMLLPCWLALVLIGYMLLFWATGIETIGEAFLISGSSLFTLGFAGGPASIHTILEFSEATIGLILVALLIAYLPAMYAAFSHREAAVSRLGARSGLPPSAAEMIARFHRIGELGNMRSFWESWETLFSELEESHTSLAALVFFRSPNPQLSWITASGTVLDTAALIASTVDTPREPQAELCILAGYVALRSIGDQFALDLPVNPQYPEVPISITRAEFDDVYDRLSAAGVALKPDRDRCWHDFAGWRVNYDASLLGLCALTMAPYAQWSSDRAPAFFRPQANFFKRRNKK